MTILTSDIHTIVEEIDFKSLRGNPNIFVAASFWEGERLQAARKCYRFMRMMDDMIDNRKAIPEMLSSMEKVVFSGKINSWMDCLGKSGNGDPFIAEVVEVVDRYKIPLDYFKRFSRSMVYDVNNSGFETFNRFLEYAEGASNMPASIFVHMCALKNIDGTFVIPEIEISGISRPCAIFSYLVHIIRDFVKDQKNNLNFFALDILKKHNLDPTSLKRIAREGKIPSNFREMMGEYVAIAEAYRRETEKTLEKAAPFFEPRYLLSLKVIFNLYLQIFEKIDVEKGNFTQEELVPGQMEIKERVIRVAAAEIPG